MVFIDFPPLVNSNSPVADQHHPQDAGSRREAQRSLVLCMPLDGGRRRVHRQHHRQLFEFHEKVQGRRVHLHGQEVLVHDEYRECNVESENVVARTEVHQQLRIRMHRDRRTHQTVCMHIMLQFILLQFGQRSRRQSANDRQEHGGCVDRCAAVLL